MTTQEVVQFWMRRAADKADQYVAEKHRRRDLESALKDIAELGAENGAAWCQTRARRVLTGK